MPASREHGDDGDSNDVINMMVQSLFSDVAMFTRDDLMEEVPDDVAFISESSETISLKKKLKEMHVLDALDFLSDEKNVIEEDVRATLLREHVQAMKNNLPTSHDEAWSHPDENFEFTGEKPLGRNFIASFM